MQTGEILKGYTLYVRTGPSISYKALGVIRGGDKFNIYETKNGWFRHNLCGGGWSPLTDHGLQLTKITGGSPSVVAKTVTASKPAKAKTPVKKETTPYTEYIKDSYIKYTNDQTADLFLKNVRGIHGMPYQYMASVDTRLRDSVFGRKYAEKIVSKMPLLLITPGKPKFMKDFSTAEKEDVFKYVAGKGDKSVIDALIKREGRFYEFEFNYAEYYDCVNPTLQMIARFLGLQNVKLDGTPLDKYKWQNYTNSSLKTFISSAECVGFYIDSEKQITESFSNSTGESALANKVNSLSDLGREMQFLLGGTAGIEFDKFKQDNYDATLKEFNNFSDKYLKLAPKNLMSKLTSGFLTVATGGKMIFPEIWNDSEFSKNYSVSMKLRSPDCDNLSLFMNIFVPMMHLICLVAPQQMGPNAYKSPFLVRASYKGFFNIDMGIITSMTIAKGDQAKWTANGLPTEVDINFDIKDLYQIMTITRQKEIVHLMNNTALMDYLANMCGININKPDIMRTIDIYFTQILNSQGIQGRFSRGMLSVEQQLSNKLQDLYKVIK